MLGMEQEHDTPCSPEQREKIIDEATFRQGFILWLAAHLERDECSKLIRMESAQALRQLVS
jgi:hypothetical protein